MLLMACAAKVATTATKSYPALPFDTEVVVFGISEPVPAGENLGTVKIGDTGFSTNCGYDIVISQAKQEARKIGGNALRIIEHKGPTALGSSCDRITAQILRVENLKSAVPSKPLGDVSYAMIHIYRPNGVGPLVGYDVYLGDSIICRARNNSRTSVKITKDGRNMLWAKTESRVEIPINIQFGNEYYLRCGLTMGALVGRPTLTIMDSGSGRAGFELVKEKK
jgi:hypothetical protein